MRDDIVIRLIEGCVECGLVGKLTACQVEAADEIERLRAENQTFKEEKVYWRLMGRETGGY